MARTQVPEEEQRVVDIDELKNDLAPTSERVVFVESDADSLPNHFWWNPNGEASNSDGVTKIESNVFGFGDGESNEGLWERTYLQFNAATSDDLAEGSTNLYYTDVRARNALSASGDLNYDSSIGEFSVTTYKSSDFDNDFSSKTTDELTEGSTNLYYTEQRVLKAVPEKGDYELSSTEGKSESTFGVNTAPEGIGYNDDGSKFYTVLSNTVKEYDLSTNYDVTTASLVSSTSISEDNDLQAIFFNNDGTKMFLAGDETELIYEYTLSTAYDTSTASFNNSSLDVSGEINSLQSAARNNDGTTFYAVDFNSGITYSYTLSTAFDASSGSFNGNTLEVFDFDSITDMAVGDSGKRFYFSGQSNNKIFEAFTTTAYNINQASLNFTLNNLSGNPTAIGVTDGTKLHYGDSTNLNIVQRSFKYQVYGLVNLEGELSALRTNTRLRLTTDKSNLDSSSLIRLQSEANTAKPAIGWWDENGDRVASLFADPDLVYKSGGVERGQITNNGIFTLSDAYVRRYSRVSSDTTTSGHEYYSVDTSGGEVTITLATADEITGRVIHVKRDGKNKVTINAEGNETIEGESQNPQVQIRQDLDALKFVFNDNTNNWEIY